MTDEIAKVNQAIESGDLVPAAEAAQEVGITSEYIRRLARDGEPGARMIGRAWYFERAAVARMKRERGIR